MADSAVAQATSAAPAADDPLGDGDQKFCRAELPGDPGFQLKNLWASGAGFWPPNPMHEISELTRAAWWGDVEKVKGILDREERGSERMRTILEERSSRLRMNALLGTIHGARMVGKPQGAQVGMPHGAHRKVVRLLLEAGARVQCRDVAGYSALHHCATAMYSIESLECALVLAEFGADANSHTRFGYPTLSETTMAHKGLAPLATLLECGALPMHKDANGYSPYALTNMIWLEARAEFSRAQGRIERIGTARLQGQRVRLAGLSKPELNGLVGVVTGFMPESIRYAVRLDQDEATTVDAQADDDDDDDQSAAKTLAIKSINIELVGLQVGTLVRLESLKAAHLNGRLGECGEWDADGGRYAVSLFPVEEANDADVAKEGKLEMVRVRPANLVDVAAERKCACCLSAGAKLFFCSECHDAEYCGKKCAKSHWPEHKKVCRAAGRWAEVDTEELKKEAGGNVTINIGTDRSKRDHYYEGAVLNSSRHRHLLKVQVPSRTKGILGGPQGLDDPVDDSQRPVMVYSRSRHVNFALKNTHPSWAAIERCAEGKGDEFNKAYIYGVIDPKAPHVVRFDLHRVQPPQAW